MEDNEKLTHYLYGHEKEMLSLWKTLVETESGPKQPTGVESVRSLLAGELAAMGFTIRLQKSRAPGPSYSGTGKRGRGGSHHPLRPYGYRFPEGKASTCPFSLTKRGMLTGLVS